MKTDTKRKIIRYIKKNKMGRPYDLANHLKISRAALHKQLLRLVEIGEIEKHGTAPRVYYTTALPAVQQKNPHYLWDYDINELKKTEAGRIKILERMINYGPGEGEKIPLDQVKKYWDRLELNYLARRLFELLIWGKYQSSPKNKKFSWI